jgi:hypothetical protein
MAVGCCDGDRALPDMVLLVDVLVEELVVKESVGIVETDLINQNADNQMNKNGLEAWKFSEVFGESFALFHVVAQASQWNSNHGLIENDNFDRVNQSCPVNWFIGVRLHLVLSQEFRRERHIHEYKSAASDPVNS